MTKKKAKPEPIITNIVINLAECTQQSYVQALSSLCGHDLSVDRKLYPSEYLWVGKRTLNRTDDGIELYYFIPGTRHSLAVVEFQANGGWKLIFHTLNKALLPKDLQATLPSIYNGLFFSSLFRGYEVYKHDGILAIKTPTTWMPMHLDMANPRHYVLIKAMDLVDNTTLSPITGANPGARDRWHTRIITPEIEATPTRRTISPLSEHAVRGDKPSLEARFNPDMEVHGIPGEEL